MAGPRTPAHRRLYDIAESQQGFFTTKQAKAAGFAENTHPYHVRVGNWIREHRGIYRLALFPPTEHPDLVLWALWSQNRKEEMEGIYSHSTALSLWELSDLNPARLHMTVPRHFRRNSEIPEILVLHYDNIPPGDVETAQGFKFTRPLRSILDLIKADSVSKDILKQAIRQALERGLITRRLVSTAEMSEAAKRLFDEALQRAA